MHHEGALHAVSAVLMVFLAIGALGCLADAAFWLYCWAVRPFNTTDAGRARRRRYLCIATSSLVFAAFLSAICFALAGTL